MYLKLVVKYIDILVLMKNQAEFYDSNRTCDAISHQGIFLRQTCKYVVFKILANYQYRFDDMCSQEYMYFYLSSKNLGIQMRKSKTDSFLLCMQQ